MFQVNLFGHMRITQSILPLFRAQGQGRIGFTSSSTAWTALPFMAHYAASKAALSAFVDGLHKEVRLQGIQCVSFECGGFPTHLGQPRDTGDSGFGAAGPAIAEYQPLFGKLIGMFTSDPMAYMPGDLGKAATRMVDVMKREGMAAGKPWAVRVAIGSDGMGSAKQRCEEQLELLNSWKELSCSTDRDGQVVGGEEMFKFTSVLES
jgi:short-subunit dehydrogenase